MLNKLKIFEQFKFEELNEIVSDGPGQPGFNKEMTALGVDLISFT